MFKQYKKRIFLVTSILGIAGSILFFPIRMENGYTCFFHRLFDHDNPVLTIAGISGEAVHEEADTFLHAYIHKWAIPWWLSLLTAAGAIYALTLRDKLKISNKPEKMEGELGL